LRAQISGAQRFHVVTDRSVSYAASMESVPRPEPKFRRRAEARPDEVLDAALALFSAQGYTQTSVEQVARRAGISKGAVYLYFPSKKALLEGLVRRTIGPVAGAAHALSSGFRGDPRPILRRVLTMIAMALSDPELLAVPKLVLREAINAPEIAQIYRSEVLDKVIPALQALLAQGVAGGFIRPVCPEMALRSIIGPIVAHLILDEVFDVTPKDGLALDRLIGTHMTLLFAGLEPPKEA
jgi:AcrR family transcriptional regulator